MISIVVLTKNEELDIAGCLSCLSWSDDVIVFDSCSTDSTVAIASSFGCRIVVRQYDDESTHKNWALDHIDFKHRWVYFCDADERLPRAFHLEMVALAQEDSSYSAFRSPRRDYFMGRWLRHCTPSPFNIRLFRPEKVRFERITNPHLVVNGQIGEIFHHFDHFPFSKGIAHWINKHNWYSDLEVKQSLLEKKAGFSARDIKQLFSSNINVRRISQKRLYYLLPLRPLIMFFSIYILKRGFLDGMAGFHYSALRCIYEYLITLKTTELKSKRDL